VPYTRKKEIVKLKIRYVRNNKFLEHVFSKWGEEQKKPLKEGSLPQKSNTLAGIWPLANFHKPTHAR